MSDREKLLSVVGEWVMKAENDLKTAARSPNESTIVQPRTLGKANPTGLILVCVLSVIRQ